MKAFYPLCIGASLLASGCASSHLPSSGAASSGRGAAAASTTHPSDEAPVPAGNPEALAHFAAGVSYELNEDNPQALDQFDDAALADPANDALVLELAERHVHDHEPGKAVRILAKAAESPGASIADLSWLSRAYLQAGNTNKALATARAAIDKDPGAVDGYECLVEACFHGNMPGEAARTLARAAKSVRREPASLITVADLYGAYSRLEPKDAEAKVHGAALLDAATALPFSSVRLWQRAATLYGQFGQQKKAAAIYLKLLDQAAGVSSEQTALREQLAQIYLEADDKTNALKQLQAIVRDDPVRYPNAWFALGEIAEQDDKYADAADDLQNAIRWKPSLEPAYYDLALALANLHRSEEALKILAEASDRFKNGFRFEFYSGLVYRAAKDYPEALRHFTAAETVAKASSPQLLDKAFYYEAGATFERNHQFKEADQYLQKAVDLDPDFAEALNYLGFMLADQGEQLPRARALIERALAIDPDNGAYLDSLGWALFKLKQPVQALPLLLRAQAGLPEPDATVLDHIGDVYFALGHIDKAIDAWKKSLSIEFNDDIKKKLDANSGG